MKKAIAILCLVLLTACAGAPASQPGQPTAQPSPRSVSILFVGNSLTYTNDIPRQLEMILSMYGIELTHLSVVLPGAYLSGLKEDAIKQMNKDHYDYAVFQDYGGASVNREEEFITSVRELCDAAKSSGAQPILYDPACAQALDANGNRVPSRTGRTDRLMSRRRWTTRRCWWTRRTPGSTLIKKCPPSRTRTIPSTCPMIITLP